MAGTSSSFRSKRGDAAIKTPTVYTDLMIVKREMGHKMPSVIAVSELKKASII